MGRDGVPQFRDPLALEAVGHHDRRAQPARAGIGPGRVRQVEHELEITPYVVGTRPVGLVDHEDVGHLEQAGLVGLDGVAGAGVGHHDGGVGGGGDIDLDLADAHGLDDHRVVAGGVEHPDRAGHREGEAPGVAAGGDRSDEGVGLVLVDPDAVTQDGAPGERR